MAIKRKTILIVGVTIVALIALSVYFIRPEYYVFINDTHERVVGDIIGNSSPSESIDIKPGAFAIKNLTWRGANILLGIPHCQDINNVIDLRVIKIVKISQQPQCKSAY
jgi:hypothetical protein